MELDKVFLSPTIDVPYLEKTNDLVMILTAVAILGLIYITKPRKVMVSEKGSRRKKWMKKN